MLSVKNLKLDNYRLVSTEGGAVVYEIKEEFTGDEIPRHQICPVCSNEISPAIILQPHPINSDALECRQCGKIYITRLRL